MGGNDRVAPGDLVEPQFYRERADVRPAQKPEEIFEEYVQPHRGNQGNNPLFLEQGGVEKALDGPAEKDATRRAKYEGEDQALGVGVGHIAEVGPGYIHRRVRDMQDAQDPVNHGKAHGDERVKAAGDDAVDQLLQHAILIDSVKSPLGVRSTRPAPLGRTATLPHSHLQMDWRKAPEPTKHAFAEDCGFPERQTAPVKELQSRSAGKSFFPNLRLKVPAARGRSPRRNTEGAAFTT